MGYDVDTLTHTVDMHIGSLRQKLEKDPRLPELILNSSRNGLQVCRLKQAHFHSFAKPTGPALACNRMLTVL